MSADPRLAVIGRRLAQVARLIAVTGGKGGIGKSLVASSLALLLARAGRRVGLLDLDLTGPCDHLILGLDPSWPEERFGLIPLEKIGLRFLSIACLVGDRPMPLRGADRSNALIELLAVIQWDVLDFLVIDMPPSLEDVLLDAVRLLRRAEYLIVATPSRIVVETVKRTLDLLGQAGVSFLGIVENMQRQKSPLVRDLAARAKVPYLGAMPYDDSLEEALGDPERLLGTPAAIALQQVARNLGLL